MVAQVIPFPSRQGAVRRNSLAARAISLFIPTTYYRVPDPVLAELKLAHQIILHGLSIMTMEQKLRWGEMNEGAGIPCEGITRHHERRAVILDAEARK